MTARLLPSIPVNSHRLVDWTHMRHHLHRLGGRTVRCAGVAGLTTFVLLAVLFAVEGIAPFGVADRTLAIWDADIQYLDFFSYLQNVLAGSDSLAYSLSKGLGGTGIAVFSYYLSSPFNLLFALVPKSGIIALFDVVVLLKLSLAASTMAIFLTKRLPDVPNALAVALSLSYALGEYPLAQASNIMWLDGVYMLPLMLLGVYRVVNGNGLLSLAVTAGLSILFNWYSGAVNCLFCIVWFFLEAALAFTGRSARAAVASQSRFPRLRLFTRRGFRFALSMALGVGLSCVLFLPTALELMGGRASGDSWMVMDFSYIAGQPYHTAAGNLIGSLSDENHVSLYCGSIALIGAVGSLFSRGIDWRYRIALAVLGAFSIALYYWYPLIVTFSLFQQATSYWFRYSYISIFALCFMAGMFFAHRDTRERNGRERRFSIAGIAVPRGYAFTVPVAVLCSAIILFSSCRYEYGTPLTLAATAIYLIACGVLLAVFPTSPAQKDAAGDKCAASTLCRAFPAITLIVLSSELLLNAHLILADLTQDIEGRDTYMEQQQQQINALKQLDTSLYRVNQTSTARMSAGSITANYNEGLAFGYPALASYTSDPISEQRNLLDSLGYPACGDNLNVVNSSILGTDSLLGVKYVLADTLLPGLEPIDELPSANGKRVYRNPYALPLAFTWSKPAEGAEGSATLSLPNSNDVFTNQNELWSQLLHRETVLYRPLPYTTETSNSEATTLKTTVIEGGSRTTTISFTSPGSHYAVYANAVLSQPEDPSAVLVNGSELAYSSWLAPTVFPIITTEEASQSFSIVSAVDNEVRDVQLYALDLDELSRAAEELRETSASVTAYSGGSLSLTATGTDTRRDLLTTVPYDDDWTVQVNGRDVEPQNVYGCLMSIPLDRGENKIELRYRIPGLVEGAAISGVSLAGTIAGALVHRRRKAAL